MIAGTKSQIIGVLLAGGQSRRMFEAQGGGDKCLADLAGRPMLAHVIDTLLPQVGALVLNANGDPARFAAFQLPVAADPISGFAGPLAGVLAGMLWSREAHAAATHIVTVSTDAPFIPSDLVAKLADAVADQPAAIALASSRGHLHPVIGLWPVALAGDLEAQLNAGTRKVLHWTDRHGIVAVEFAATMVGGEEIDPFFNANRPAEMDEARRLLANNKQRIASSDE